MSAAVLRCAPRGQLSALVKVREIVAEVKSEYLSQSKRFPWIVGFSGGKDSTVLAQAVVEAVLEISPNQRTRDVHVVANDTLVKPNATAMLRVYGVFLDRDFLNSFAGSRR